VQDKLHLVFGPETASVSEILLSPDGARNDAPSVRPALGLLLVLSCGDEERSPGRFGEITSAVVLTGNGVTLLRNVFVEGSATVPSSNAVLVDIEGIP
jgi:hypothetical protein